LNPLHRSREMDEESMLYLLNYNGYWSVVGEDENWTVAYEMRGPTGRLFAGAPELLASMKDLLQQIRLITMSDSVGNRTLAEAMDLSRADAAIAKVERGGE